MTRPKIVNITAVGENARGEQHQVVSVEGGASRSFRCQPCSDCPWRLDATGEFPPDAFRRSARTAYDMATEVFACHQSGVAKPAACAGFLLRGAHHNLAIRLRRMRGECLDVDDGGHELHDSYRAMAIANGVPPDDPALGPCRDET